VTLFTTMYPTLSDVETFCVQLPTFDGILAIFFNSIAIIDWLSVSYRTPFIVCCFLLWTFPIYFVLPVAPFKYAFILILYILGFEKVPTRRGSYATQHPRYYYDGSLPQYSTLPHPQSAALLGEEIQVEEDIYLPIYARILGWVAGILAVRALFF